MSATPTTAEVFGDGPSSGQGQGQYRTKIVRFDTRGKVMDVADMILHELDRGGTLSEGKLIFNYCEYDKDSKKAKQTFKHYMDLDVARRLFHDVLACRFRKDPKDAGRFLALVDKEEFKGGKHYGSDGWEYESRRMSVVFNDQLNIGPCVQFRFALGEGQPTDTGAIVPKGEPKYTGQMNVTLDVARAGAATVLDYISSVRTAYMLKSMLSDVDERLNGMESKIDSFFRNSAKASRPAA